MNPSDAASHRPQWAERFFAVRDRMRGWIDAAISRHSAIPYHGGHDEGTFISSWLGFHQLFGAPRALDFARFLRDGFAEWARENMLHGFYPRGEAHHQTEIFTFFLCRLWRVAPDDETAELIVDAAHHIGNWVEGFPEWYDHDRQCFLSWRIGTEQIGGPRSRGYEVPDHFRLIQLALSAHDITGEQRYLDLSTAYADRWSEAILEAPMDEPPTVIRSGDSAADQSEVFYAIGAHHHGDSPLERAEPHVPAGTVDVLLDLYAMIGHDRYAEAARRICQALLPALSDPYSNPPGALLSRYRADTGDTSLDDAAIAQMHDGIEETLVGLDGMLRLLERTRVSGYALTAGRLYASLADNPFAADRLEASAELYERLVGERPTLGRRVETPAMVVETLSGKPVAGIGKRKDMVRWAWENELGALRPTSALPPPTLMLAWQILGDESLAESALRTVGDRVALAVSALRDGRDHGCAGSTIGAVASGHGRDGGYGNVTGAFFPLAAGMIRRLSQEEPRARFRADGEEHLPETVASLVRTLPAAGAEVLLFNDAEQPVSLEVALRNTPWRSVELQPGAVTQVELP
ncbi:MAG: hypothetical protein ACOX9R_10050 [Armatimonadota bacterium]|jgi:hypothetical protein